MPIPAIAIGAALSAIPEVVKIIRGITAKNSEVDPIRPEYAIPDAMLSAVNQSRQMANTGLSGDYMRLVQGNIGSNLATSIAGLTAVGGNSNVLAGLVGKANELYMDAALKDEQIRSRNNAAYQSALKELADYQDAQFEFNKYQPYLLQREKYLTAEEEKNKLRAGIVEGAVGLAGVGAQTVNAQRYDRALKDAMSAFDQANGKDKKMDPNTIFGNLPTGGYSKPELGRDPVTYPELPPLPYGYFRTDIYDYTPPNPNIYNV